MNPKILIDCRWVMADNGFASVIKMILKAIDTQEDKFYLLINENAKDFNFNEYIKNPNKFDVVIAKAKPFSLLQNIEIPLMIKKYKIDIFHTLNYDIPLFRFSKFKLISTIHDLIPITHKKLHKRNMITTLYFEIMYRLCAVLSYKIMTVSNYSKKEIVKYLPCREEKIQVIYNSYLPKNINQDKKVNQITQLLFVGSNFEHKNIHVVIEAVKLLKEKNIIVNFNIAGGKYKYTEYLELLVKKYNLENQIKILGKVDDKTLAELYSQADVYVFPSLIEGFGIPLLEAMDYGIPVISSNKTVMPEVVGDAGILIEPTEEHFAEKIELIISNPELKEELIQKGYARVKYFSQEKFSAQLLKLYGENCGND